VPRPRLTERLTASLDCRLTLVSAPDGLGKTRLLREWVSDSGPDVRFSWLLLDEGDDDPARFLTHLVAALRTVDGAVGRADPPEQLLAAISSTG
jgi:LuxR family maltose regulon positive regulatory protein